MTEKILTSKDLSDGERIAEIFEKLTEEDKNIVLGYTFALHDKSRMTSQRELLQHT